MAQYTAVVKKAIKSSQNNFYLRGEWGITKCRLFLCMHRAAKTKSNSINKKLKIAQDF